MRCRQILENGSIRDIISQIRNLNAVKGMPSGNKTLAQSSSRPTTETSERMR